MPLLGPLLTQSNYSLPKLLFMEKIQSVCPNLIVYISHMQELLTLAGSCPPINVLFWLSLFLRATHGGATDQNAHPHLDEQQRVAVVHNGVIENYSDLKKQLVEDGVEFSSETDTEVIAQMVFRLISVFSLIVDLKGSPSRKEPTRCCYANSWSSPRYDPMGFLLLLKLPRHLGSCHSW